MWTRGSSFSAKQSNVSNKLSFSNDAAIKSLKGSAIRLKEQLFTSSSLQTGPLCAGQGVFLDFYYMGSYRST